MRRRRRYNGTMREYVRVASGRVVDGRIEIDGEALEEGRRVKLIILEDDPVTLTAEEREFLLKAMAEVDRGETVDAFEFLRELERTR